MQGKLLQGGSVRDDRLDRFHEPSPGGCQRAMRCDLILPPSQHGGVSYAKKRIMAAGSRAFGGPD
jgi:hypothetical protein